MLRPLIHRCSRGDESYVIHLVEQGDYKHRHILSNKPPDADDVESKGLVSKHPLCLPVPSETNNDISAGFADLQDPITGHRMSPKESVNALDLLVSTMPRKEGSHPLYDFAEEPSDTNTSQPRYSCVVSLPSFRRIRGPPSKSKEVAKQSACFLVCGELFRAGLLDYRLFPSDKTVTNSEESLIDPKQRSGTRGYLCKEPNFWANTRVPGAPPLHLYPTVITTSYVASGNRTHSPLAILTRMPLPKLRSINLFDASVPFVVDLTKAGLLQVDEARLQVLYHYTLRVIRTISNKPYECAIVNMPYFLAPLTENWIAQDTTSHPDPFFLPSIVDYIPWDLVAFAGQDYVVPMQQAVPGEAAEGLRNVVIQDRWVEFTRRYSVIRLRPDLTPMSKLVDSPVCLNFFIITSLCLSCAA
jgi:endoribonuclease Dicer